MNRSSVARILLLGLLWALPLGAAEAETATVPLAGSELVGRWHETKQGPISLPSDVEVAPDGTVWVVDSGNHRVVAFDPSGKVVTTLGEKGSDKGQLRGPLGLGIGPQGRIFVADSGNRRIQVFSPEGEPRSELPMKDQEGRFRPADVAVNADGEMFVTVTDRHAVAKWSSGGTLLQTWGGKGTGEGELRYPATIVVRDGLVYVVDVLNTRVQVFDEEGKYQHQIGEWGVRPGQMFRPKGVAVDSRGWVYVSDSYMDLVQAFEDGYEFDHVVGKGDQIREFVAATGLAVSGKDRLYVCEMLADRVTVVQLP